MANSHIGRGKPKRWKSHYVPSWRTHPAVEAGFTVFKYTLGTSVVLGAAVVGCWIGEQRGKSEICDTLKPAQPAVCSRVMENQSVPTLTPNSGPN